MHFVNYLVPLYKYIYCFRAASIKKLLLLLIVLALVGAIVYYFAMGPGMRILLNIYIFHNSLRYYKDRNILSLKLITLSNFCNEKHLNVMAKVSYHYFYSFQTLFKLLQTSLFRFIFMFYTFP